VVEQWTENPRVSGSIPLLDIVNLSIFIMKLITKNVINKLKNSSLKGSPHVLNVIVNTSTLQLLTSLYKEGLIQSMCISPTKLNKSLFFVHIYLRIVGGISMLSRIKIFSSRNLVLKLKNITRLPSKQTTVFVSTKKGVTTLLYLKKHGSGGTLLFSC